LGCGLNANVSPSSASSLKPASRTAPSESHPTA
jgi:hypothetical protein